MAFEYTKYEIDEYVKGKTWYWYLPLWFFGLYLFVQLLGFSYDKQMPFLVMVPYSLDFALHEFAHIFTGFLPHIVSAAAGSFSELLLGSLLIFVAYKTRGYFASLFCFLWFMLACQSAGLYMADARAQNMELVSLGGALSGSDKVIHDWNFIFGELGLLNQDKLIGGSVCGIGIAAGIFGLIFAAWLLYKMAASSDVKSMPETEKEILHKATTSASFDSQGAKQNTLYPVPTKGALVERPPIKHSSKEDRSDQS